MNRAGDGAGGEGAQLGDAGEVGRFLDVGDDSLGETGGGDVLEGFDVDAVFLFGELGVVVFSEQLEEVDHLGKVSHG